MGETPATDRLTTTCSLALAEFGINRIYADGYRSYCVSALLKYQLWPDKARLVGESQSVESIGGV